MGQIRNVRDESPRRSGGSRRFGDDGGFDSGRGSAGFGSLRVVRVLSVSEERDGGKNRHYRNGNEKFAESESAVVGEDSACGVLRVAFRHFANWSIARMINRLNIILIYAIRFTAPCA